MDIYLFIHFWANFITTKCNIARVCLFCVLFASCINLKIYTDVLTFMFCDKILLSALIRYNNPENVC